MRRYIAECRSLVKPSIRFTVVFESNHHRGYLPIIRDLMKVTGMSRIEIKKDYEVLWIIPIKERIREIREKRERDPQMRLF